MRKNLAKLLVVAVAMMTMVGTVSAATTDDVTLTATLSQDLSISCTADVSFGNISPELLYTDATNCTVDTNSGTGYTMTALDDATAGMDGSTHGEVIPAAASTSVDNSNNGFGMYAVADATGNGVVDEGFDNDSTADLALSTSAQTVITDSDQTNDGGDIHAMNWRLSADSTRAADTYTTTVTFSVVAN